MIKDIENLDGWNIVGLPDIVFFQEGPGVRNNQYTDSGVKLINVANLKDGKVYLENTERYISEEEAYGRYRHFLVDEGDLIIASSGIKVEYFDKKMGFINKEHLPLCMNTSTIRFKTLDENILDIKYFAYFLKTIYFKKQIARLITGSAQLNFGPSHLKKIKVILPPLNIQKKIVEVLEKSQYVINKRSEQIEELELLVKSKFIEMFGDPYLNPKRWAKKELKEIMLLANNGLSRRGNDLDGNIVLRLVELQDGYLDYTSVNRIKLTESEEKRYLLKDGDFLFARVNGNPDNVGRCAYYQEIGEKVFHNDHIIRVRFDNTLINNCFVSTMLNSGYGKLQMKDKLKTSAGQYTVNQTGISEIKVVVPPIELQNKFEDFVKQIDKLKFEIEQSLKELEDNFNSLMQKAFKGELFN
ncbi:restriction endonuclease subunit S [Clostridium perfringens]